MRSFVLRTSIRIATFLGLASCTSIFGISNGQPGDPDATTPNACEAVAAAEACDTEGARRCSGTLQQECVAGPSGCRAWSTPAECAAGSLCCESDGEVACIPVSGTNCYACGTTCVQPMPECLAGPKKCGCNAVSCAAFSQGCDVTTGGCADCQDPAADVTEVFVDAQSPPFAISKPRGTKSCPFYTITAALAWVRAHPTVTTVRVAAGTYADETFPLDVRGLALIGAGSSKTIIRGQGTFNRSALQGQLAFTDMRATVVAGHPSLATRIEGLALERPTALVAMDEKDSGLLCDQGNIKERTPAVVPPANTIVRDLVVGKGFARSVVVSNSTATAAASGCNLKISASELRGGPGHGIAAWGAQRAGTTAAQGDRGVAVEIGGPDPADAVVIRDYRSGTFFATGVFVGSIGHVRASRLTVDASDVGMAVEQEATNGAHPVAEIRRLAVTNGNNMGLWLNCDARLSVLEDSDISGVNRARVPGSTRGFGLTLTFSDATYCAGGSPAVLRARRNRIFGNDYGVVMTNIANSILSVAMDFGTAQDPGENVIRCNSQPTSKGHDLHIDKPRSALLSFYGNEWDHVKNGKPTVQTDASDPIVLPEGVDVALLTDETNLVLTGARAGTEPCPAGKVEGPAPP
jgi:hypothetical protein